jgi:hypothetical protein
MPRCHLNWCWSLPFAVIAGAATGSEALPYPTGPLTVEQIVQQVYAASHGGLVRNAASRRNRNEVALVVNRAPRDLRKPGRKPTVQTFHTYVNNSPQDPDFDSLQMAILTSGKARGTGVLLTSYTDPARSSVISMWLPALRKIRRINEPAHEDVWFGTNLTYGELVLRRPEHEHHELLGEDRLQGCLDTMELERWEMTRYTHQLPGPQCEHQGKAVYRLKSTTKFENWWYDYHISDIDKTTFGVYRTVYFKGEEKIKTVDVDWQSLDQPDPRVIYPRYIYAISHADGKDSLVYVPRSTITLDMDISDSFWSEDSLRDYRP